MNHLKHLILLFPRHHVSLFSPDILNAGRADDSPHQIFQSGLNDELDDDEDDMMEPIQPWASGPFANLLVQLAPTLLYLILTSGVGSAMAAPDLQAAPHAGSLDHALSHCRHLISFQTAWSVLSDGFLDAVANSPALETLCLCGPDIPVSAAAISESCNAIRAACGFLADQMVLSYASQPRRYLKANYRVSSISHLLHSRTPQSTLPIGTFVT